MRDQADLPHEDGIRSDHAGSTAGPGESSVSSGGIVSPAPSGGSGDRGQDGSETQTGPGPQTDWLRDAGGSGDVPDEPGGATRPGSSEG